MIDYRYGTPVLYAARCGHEWLSAAEGSYACPVCGLHDGDHHLTRRVFLLDRVVALPFDLWPMESAQ